MSTNKLALLLAGALILLSVAGITYLNTERAGATRLTTTHLNGELHGGIGAREAAIGSPTHGAPHSFPGQVPLSQPQRQVELSRVAASALVGGTLGAGPKMIVSSEAR